MYRKLIASLMVSIILLFAYGCGNDNLKRYVFTSDIDDLNWDSYTDKIADAIKAKPEEIMLQELTIAWNNNKLEDVHMQIIVEGSNDGYSIYFSPPDGKTSLTKMDKDEKTGSEVPLKDVFSILQIHGLKTFGNGIGKAFIMLSRTNDAFTYTQAKSVSLYKLGPKTSMPFIPGESKTYDYSTTFVGTGGTYILEALSKQS